MRIRTITAAAVALLVSTTLTFAVERGTKDEAIAMVKKAVTAIGKDGPEKTYSEVDAGKFLDRDIYIVVLGLDGKILAHSVNPKQIGKNFLELQDVDGKFFIKEMVSIGAKQDAFWEDFKFTNPQTKKVEPKQMYCNRVSQTLVCAGVYKS
jgi:cytochrome c